MRLVGVDPIVLLHPESLLPPQNWLQNRQRQTTFEVHIDGNSVDGNKNKYNDIYDGIVDNDGDNTVDVLTDTYPVNKDLLDYSPSSVTNITATVGTIQKKVSGDVNTTVNDETNDGPTVGNSIIDDFAVDILTVILVDDGPSYNITTAYNFKTVISCIVDHTFNDD
ncbi:hypothetical protein NDU88_005597 [Pleurodeles waltl]|uniref:Uncharacterized protein n=1 Tax=Pleurodeles waltl TaxID=8319 RepID=A0AAV7TCF4_PLEWA|nr:hypothetical protein NDU88_005597 [Pleurodeles waltl]